MKTNEWLAVFLQENKGEFVQGLIAEASSLGLQVAQEDAEKAVVAFEGDFDGEVCEAGPAELLRLADGDGVKAGELWKVVEQRVGDHIGREPELTGGARRLAYLRLSEYAVELKAALG